MSACGQPIMSIASSSMLWYLINSFFIILLRTAYLSMPGHMGPLVVGWSQLLTKPNIGSFRTLEAIENGLTSLF